MQTTDTKIAENAKGPAEHNTATCVLEQHTKPVTAGGCHAACPECLGTCTLNLDHNGLHCCPQGHRWL